MQRTSRETVLDAIDACVREVGVRRTTFAEVARRAGLSRSTLYTHFQDVDEGIAALMTRELARLLDDTTRATGDATHGRDRLVAAATTMAREVPEHPLFRRVLEVDAELLLPYVFERLGSSQRRMLDAVVDLVAAGQADGSVRDGDAKLIAFTVLLITQSFVLSSRIAAAEHDRDDVLHELRLAIDRTLRP